MSLDPFPERIDAVKLFARKGSITAALPLVRLQRLTDCLSDHKGQIEVDLHFGTDEEGRRLLSGTLHARVKVSCQRCLRDMDLDLDCPLHLLVFDTEQEVEAVPETQDAVALTEAGLDVLALIEDELLLSLPMVPMHADINCNQALNALRQGSTVEGTSAAKPFAVLAGLELKTEQAGKSDKEH
jgi:uncharacterized protein